MAVRYLLPGIIWYLAMWLLFLTPVAETVPYYGGVPARSLVHGVLFMGFSHLWLAGLMKQLRYDKLRDKAFMIVLIGAVATIIATEILTVIVAGNANITWWNVLFDILGSAAGMGSFKLLYHKCY